MSSLLLVVIVVIDGMGIRIYFDFRVCVFNVVFFGFFDIYRVVVFYS